MSGRPALLEGIAVVEVGDGIAGSVAAATLAALGAAVRKVVAAERAHADHEPRVGSQSAITAVLDHDKDVGTTEPTDADVLIVDSVDRRAELPQATAGVTVVITPFGADGPYADRAGGELVAAASGGLLGTIESEAGDGRPVSPPGFVALRSVGAVAALAALHGLDRHRRTGEPVVVEVSAQEAVVFVAALPECAHVMFDCPGRAGSGRYVAPSGVFACKDGHVRITAVENHQWKGMVAALGSPDWTQGLDERPARVEHAERINAEVAAWTAVRDKADCAELLQGHGVPATPVNTPDEVLTSPQLIHRKSIQSVQLAGEAAKVLAPPWRTELAEPSVDRAAGVEGLRVIELTHVLAGPIVGALLGAMGATVIRVEDLDRLDIYRRTGPFAGGVAGPERGAYFAVANHSKRSVAAGADLADVVDKLVSNADVLIENVGRSRLERIGLDLPARAGSGLLGLSVSGFGCEGPAARYRAYANNVQAYGGLAWLTRDHDGALARFGSVLADPLSSVIAATVIAAWALGPRRTSGAVVDLAMVEVVAGCISEYVASASTGQTVEPPAGNELAPYAPHAVFPAADGRHVAIAIHTDAEWARLVDALGDKVLDQAEWSSAAARRADAKQVDAALASLVRQRSADEIVTALAGRGLRVAAVAAGADLVVDPHLEARGFFPSIDHPELPAARIVGLPWRFVGAGPIPLAGAPALGSTSLDEALEVLR